MSQLQPFQSQVILFASQEPAHRPLGRRPTAPNSPKIRGANPAPGMQRAAFYVTAAPGLQGGPFPRLLLPAPA